MSRGHATLMSGHGRPIRAKMRGESWVRGRFDGRGKQGKESDGTETGRAPDKPEAYKLESRASGSSSR